MQLQLHQQEKTTFHHRIGLILPPFFLCDVDVSELHSNLRVLLRVLKST